MATNSKRVLVIANGKMPSMEIVKNLLQTADFVVACDGGYHHCKQLEITPNLLCGDFDSIDSELLSEVNSEFTEVIHMQNQEKSDLSKTLSHLKNEGFTSIDVIGIDGGRLDHQFGIWSSLIESNSFATLHYDDFIVNRVPNHTVQFHTKSGKIVSLNPIITCEGVSLEGCKFNLNDESLEIGTRGIHNIALNDIIEISKVSGELLIMIER